MALYMPRGALLLAHHHIKHFYQLETLAQLHIDVTTSKAEVSQPDG